MKKLTQPIKYPGGKNYLAKWIIKHFPKRYVSYIEPYFGGGSVLLHADPEGHSEVINDLDCELMNFWEVLQSSKTFGYFRQLMEKTPFSEKLFDDAKDIKIIGNSLEMKCHWARQFFIRCRQSLAGRKDTFAPISTSRVRRGMNEQVSAWLTAIEGLPVVHARLKRVLILNRPAVDVIKQLDNKGSLFYLDPPYMHETRATTKEYGKYEMTPEQHKELLETLAGIDGKFILSGYRSGLYDAFAKKNKWIRADIKIPNNAAGGKVKRTMTESIWMNYR